MKKLLELIAKVRIKMKILKILIMYHYLIHCKLKLNLHRNYKLCMY